MPGLQMRNVSCPGKPIPQPRKLEKRRTPDDEGCRHCDDIPVPMSSQYEQRDIPVPKTAGENMRLLRHFHNGLCSAKRNLTFLLYHLSQSMNMSHFCKQWLKRPCGMRIARLLHCCPPGQSWQMPRRVCLSSSWRETPCKQPATACLKMRCKE